MVNNKEVKISRLRLVLRFAVAGIGVALGSALGLGLYTFEYASGSSYLTNDPKACVNCHIMSEQYEGWLKGSHKNVATCNDCHAPHSLIGKYVTKATNGFWHSFAFTTGKFHEPIQIKARNKRVTEGACRYCHQEVVHSIDSPYRGSENISCLHCHRSVGHLH